MAPDLRSPAESAGVRPVLYARALVVRTSHMAPHTLGIAMALLVTALTQISPARAQGDPLAGKRLYADVERYASFGLHRYGTEGDRATTDWIADEMRKAGLAV